MREIEAAGLSDRRGDRRVIDPHLARGLIREQGDELFGEPAKLRRSRALITQCGEFVGNERVIDDHQAHVVTLVGAGWWCLAPRSVTIDPCRS